MKLLITGGSGFIGRALTAYFTHQGHSVVSLRRGSTTPPYWQPDQGVIDLGDQRFDVVIHLAGENIASGRWTKKKKERILSSRVQGTQCIAEYFSQAENRPKLLICSSAVGIYGDRADEQLTEASAQGTGFLAQVCKQWEEALAPVVDAGVRVVNIRLGMVLDAQGGALAKMLVPFKMGLGCVFGNGQQYMSWIALADVVGAVAHIVEDESLSGPINLCSPQPVTNRQFTKTLGCCLHRPTFLPLPSWIAKIILGEMAEALLLSSSRIVPIKLIESGYRFQHATLESALAGCQTKHGSTAK